ncbi:MAG: glutamate-1-semialdehyde 2,1-aminomutase [Anaerolineales bacterium]|nr:glutamate-1-semialdehyde 2,1-aminomutase [Anaerolineales bacterium]
MEHPMPSEQARKLQQRAHQLIPGGAHTYAKGDDQYPENAPPLLVRGAGCHVWDVDGNEYIEYAMGLRSVTLGHGYQPVVEAAYRAMQGGTNFTRPSLLEAECAERVLDVLGYDGMIKFAKNGSDATTAAVKLARAYTGRDMVAICGDHPFFSVDDWFIGATGMPGGIPESIRALTVKFHYNDLASLASLFAAYPDRIACVMMEAETTEPPKDQFLQRVQELCHQHGAVFILDEIITGFRWDLGGAQRVYGIVPDLCTFGKAMANGFALAALVGRRELMERGGIHHPHERVFLLSTTAGAESHALAAAIATIGTYEQHDVVGHLHRQGERLRRGIEQVIERLDLAPYFQVLGRPCNLIFATRDQTGERSQAFRTLFMQETAARGLLTPSFVTSFSHSDADIDYTVDAVGGALAVYRQAIENGVEHYLRGASVKPVMRLRC